jgi:hypothetical protein
MSRWRAILDPKASKTCFFTFSCLMLLSWGGLGGIEARGDLLRMPDGAVVDIGWDYRVADGKVYVRRPEGTLAIPMQSGARIEKTERPKAAAVPLPRPGEGIKESAAAEPAKPPQGEEQSGGRDKILGEMKGIVQDARALIRDLGRDPIQLSQEKEASLEDVAFWLERTRAAKEQLAAAEPPEADLEDTVADLSSTLETFRGALEREDGEALLAQDEPLEAIQRGLE